MNNFLKSFLKGVGPNLTEKTCLRISKSLGVLRDLIQNVDQELAVFNPSGYHINRRENDDIRALVGVFMETGVFINCPGREHTAFPAFNKDLFTKLSYRELWSWMREKLDEWSTVHI